MVTSPSENPQRADARRNYDKIVAAAEALFAREGVEVPFRRVAESAGVGQGTLYRHFSSKRDLVVQIYQRRLDRYEAFVNDHDHDPNLLRDLLRAVAADQRAVPTLFRVIEKDDPGPLGAAADSPSDKPQPASDVTALRHRTEQIFSLALTRSQQAGGAAARLQTNDVLIMIAMLFGAANSPLARLDRQDAIQRGLAIIEASIQP